MSNVLDRLSPGFQALTAQFAAAGLDLSAILAAGPTGLKDKLESLKNSGDVAAAVESATAALQAQLTAEQGKVTTLNTQLSALNSAVAAFGAAPKAADEKAGLTAADIEKSLNDRASIKAAEQLAKHGLAAPLAVTPAADATKPGAVTPVTIADHYKAMDELPAAEQRAYFAKHIKPLQR